MLFVIYLLLGSYLLGALPFGLWIAKRWKGIDIRTVGSGNIGSTNVWRICGPVAGSVVFLLDVLKGLLPPIVGTVLQLKGLLPPVVGTAHDSRWQVLAALLAIVGHNYSIFLGFKGGKGIATSLGALLGVCPLTGLTAFGLFGIEMLILGYVSLGSLIGALSLPILMPLYYPGDHYRLAFGVAACLMAFYKHRANIDRLRRGVEPRVRLGKRQAAAPPAPHEAEP